MSELQWKSALYQLRSRLVSGELIGGTKLRASHLALAGEGLLIREKSGFTVRSFALNEVFEAIDLRGILEGAAVQKAAERGVADSDIEELNAFLIDLDQVILNGHVEEYEK